MPHAVMAGVTSGIGSAIADDLVARGWSVTGTSRRSGSVPVTRDGMHLVSCDFRDRDSVDRAVAQITASTPPWDALIVAPGTMHPIGPFADVDFPAWQESLEINLISQLRLVHGLLRHARTTAAPIPKCVFFAGGGTNSAPVAFSAYVLSKIALIKATELLDAEIPGVAFTIIGPGWVRTDIHQETLTSSMAPAAVVEETRRRLEQDDFVEMADVVAATNWVLGQSKDVVGGRNFSVADDPFTEPGFADFLAADPSLFKLRRSGNEAYWSHHEP